MKRRVLLILLLLVAGAIVNIAVAWGCSIGRDQRIDTGKEIFWEENTEHHFGRQFEGFGFCGIWLSVQPASTSAQPLRFFKLGRSSLPPWCFAFETDPRDIPKNWYSEDYASGWPSLSMRSRFITDRIWYLRTDLVRVCSGLRLSDKSLSGNKFIRRALPLQPIWPGFAINTAFYALFLCGLFAVPAALRRKRRRARGLCPKCAYPVGDSPVCTECGAALSKHKAQTQKTERA